MRNAGCRPMSLRMFQTQTQLCSDWNLTEMSQAMVKKGGKKHKMILLVTVRLGGKELHTHPSITLRAGDMSQSVSLLCKLGDLSSTPCRHKHDGSNLSLLCWV